jgi:ariadne-1
MESPEKCNAEAGLETGRQPRVKRMRHFACQVCFDDDGTKETIALTCNHRYCRDCYTAYLNQKIK